jgi:hypothetical protein
VIFFVGSLILGLLGATGTAIALLGHSRAAAWFILITQPLGTTYDILTHQYGFLILAVVGIIVPVMTLRKGGSPSFFSVSRDQR